MRECLLSADGRVVALNYGCGAHSEVEGGEIEGVAIVVTDEQGWDHVDLSEVEDLPADEPVEVTEAVESDEVVVVDEDAVEPESSAEITASDEDEKA